MTPPLRWLKSCYDLPLICSSCLIVDTVYIVYTVWTQLADLTTAAVPLVYHIHSCTMTHMSLHCVLSIILETLYNNLFMNPIWRNNWAFPCRTLLDHGNVSHHWEHPLESIDYFIFPSKQFRKICRSLQQTHSPDRSTEGIGLISGKDMANHSSYVLPETLLNDNLSDMCRAANFWELPWVRLFDFEIFARKPISAFCTGQLIWIAEIIVCHIWTRYFYTQICL